MHPLLSPTTHADLNVAAVNLADSGLYNNLHWKVLYSRMLLGTTIGLTIFESALGVSIEQGRTVVERVLIERVLHRHEVKVTTVNLDEKIGCQLEFTRSGRKLGVIVLQTKDVPSPDYLYEYALMKGIRAYLMDVFPHKIYLKSELPAVQPEHPLLPTVKAEMSKVSRVQVLTADQLTVPKHPSKMALAKDSQTLLDWKQKLKTLNAEIPAEWDDHLSVLIDFAFLTEEQKDDVFGSMLEFSRSFGVDYNTQTGRFFLAEVPAYT